VRLESFLLLSAISFLRPRRQGEEEEEGGGMKEEGGRRREEGGNHFSTADSGPGSAKAALELLDSEDLGLWPFLCEVLREDEDEDEDEEGWPCLDLCEGFEELDKDEDDDDDDDEDDRGAASGFGWS